MRYCFLIVFFCLIYSNTSAYRPLVTNYDYSDYHAGGENWAAVEDSMGYLFVANESGILLFDGQEWDLVANNKHSTTRCLVLGDRNRIYAGGDNDIGYIERNESGKHVYVSLLNLLPEVERHVKSVWTVHYLNDEVIFQSEEALYVYDGKQFIILPIKGFVRASFLVNDALFVVDINRGMLQYSDGELYSSKGGGMLKHDEVNTILPFENGDLLVFSARHGMLRYSNGQFSAWEDITINDELKLKYVFNGLKWGGNFVFGTTQNGLYIISEDGKNVQNVSTSNGLQVYTVFNLYSDHYGGLWVCLEQGLDYFAPKLPVGLIDERSGVSGEALGFYLADDKVLLNTTRGLFQSEYNGAENIQNGFENFSIYKGLIGPTYFTKEIGEGLYCGHLQGLWHVTDEGKTNVSNYGQCFDAFSLGADNSSILAFFDNGIQILSKNGNDFEVAFEQETLIEAGRVVQKSQSVFWVTNRLGVYQLELTSDLKSVKSLINFGEEDGLPSQFENSVFNVGDEILFGTENGVYSYNEMSKVFTEDDRFEFFKGVSVDLLYLDSKNRLWYQIGKNVGRLDHKEFEVGLITDKGAGKSLGVQWLNTFKDRFNTIKEVNDDVVIFAGQYGYILYRPEKFFDLTMRGELAFKSITVKSDKNNDTFFYHERHGFNRDDAKSAAFYPDRIPGHYNTIEFEVSDFFYQDGHRTMYSYKLSGSENEWSEWSANNKRVYQNLSPGKYVFHVRSQNVFGNISEEEVFEFSLSHDWLMELGFPLAQLIILVLVIYYAMNIQSMAKKNKLGSIFLLVIAGIASIQVLINKVETWMHLTSMMNFVVLVVVDLLIALLITIVLSKLVKED